MSVIAEVRVSTDDFELGQLLETGMGPNAVVELETVVPTGDDAVPYFRIATDHLEEFLEAVRDEPAVDRLRVVDDYGEESLLAFEWDTDRDPLFDGVLGSGMAVLAAHGGNDWWTFELRFDDHSVLETFRRHCAAVGVDLDLVRVYSPSSPEQELSFGLTDPQREALTLAVARGYYEIPRRYTTAALAEELGISDQAVSERLRRGISRLVRHTVLLEGEERS